MPTYHNDSTKIYTLNTGLLEVGSEFFRPGNTVQTRELLDSLPDVVRTADTPYAHESRTISTDDTMTPWVWTPKGEHVLILGGDWQGVVTVQRAIASDGSDAVLAGEFTSDEPSQVHALAENIGAYYRYGFLATGLSSGSLNGNMQVGE